MAIGVIRTQSIVPTVLNKTVAPLGLGLTASRGTPGLSKQVVPSGFGLTTALGTPSGFFPVPDILNRANFNSGTGGWSGFTDYALNTPPQNTTRDNTITWPNGNTWSAKNTFANGVGGCQLERVFANFGDNRWNRLWGAFYFRLTNYTDDWKFARWHAPDGGNLGGLYVRSPADGPLGWNFDSENSAIISPLPLNQSVIVDSNPHYFECEYWRVGHSSGFPAARFWYDGAVCAFPNGTSGGGVATWQNGYLIAGERNNTLTLGAWALMSTLNAGTTSGQANMTAVSISSLGRVGPA